MNIPEGWKLVPVEPTDEMASYIFASSGKVAWQNYRAMLAAAPTPQAQWWKLVREWKDEDLFECKVCHQRVLVQKDGVALPEECPNCNDRPGPTTAKPKFDKTYCSQCGSEFGPGDHGYSTCASHRKATAYLNDMGHEQKLSFEPLPGAFEHTELVLATPPAPEVEKFEEWAKRELDVDCDTCNHTDMQAPRKLYQANPANDGLRKAAEEVSKALNAHLEHHVISYVLLKAIKNLSAELDKNK